MNLDTITVATIIKISEPERLFSSPTAFKDEYRKLAKRFHPDHGGDHGAFAHLSVLYDEAEKKVKDNKWHTPGVLEVTPTAKGSSTKIIRYRSKHEVEFGKLYVSDTVFTEEYRSEFADVFRKAEPLLRFKYADAKLEKEVSKLMPKLKSGFSNDTHFYQVYEKTEDQFLLRDLFDHYNGVIDPKHVAWMVSRMFGICCYFEIAGLTHNAISLDSCLVSPKYHSIALIGSWMYACRLGDKLTAVPSRTFPILPLDVQSTKMSSKRVDLNLVRQTGRELLGDKTGRKYPQDVPKPMADYLRLPSTGSAIEDFDGWMKSLKDSFGARRFVEMIVSASDIYSKE